MKSVTQGFLDLWGKKGGKPEVIAVYYKRRYWNGAAYAYETNWKQITSHKMVNIGQITWKLDTPLLNNIKASNLTVYLRNTDWEWVEQNQMTGVFAPDSVATQGYDPFLTLFQIQFGYTLANGTNSLITIFTGVAIDYIHDTQQGFTEVLVSGNEYLLQAATPRSVSDTFGNPTPESCSPATGDGSNKTFNTVSVGVAYIPPVTGVLVNGVAKEQGIDYTLSNLDVYQGTATIVFFNAPEAGKTVKVQNGLKWKASQKIEVLIGYLCDASGITAGNRTINPAIFPGGALARQIYQATADWQTGVANLDIQIDPAVTTANTLAMFFGDVTPFTDSSLNGWGFTGGGFGHFSPNPNGSGYGEYYNYSGGGGENNTLTKTAVTAYGSWSFDWLCNVYSAGATQLTPYIFDFGGRYQLYNLNASGFAGTYQLRRDNSSIIGSFAGGPSDSAWHTFLVTRDYTNVFSVYVDGVLKLQVTDGTYSTFSTMTITFTANAVGGPAYLPAAMRNIVINGSTSANWYSGVLDLVGPLSYGTISTISSIPANTSIDIYTQSSTSNSPFNDPDGWKALGGGGQVQSAVREYFKIKVVMSRSGSYTITPSMTKLVFGFTTAQVLLALADFSSYATCFDAVQSLAQLCDYEWGFDASGKFFFRAKATGSSPVVTMRPDNIISNITGFRPGYDAVINDGQVTYNEYFSEYNSASLPEASPTSQQRFLTLTRAEDWSQLLLAYDIDIATGRAQVLHDNYYNPRRRCKVRGKIVPHLDLSDVVNVSYWDNRLNANPAIWGDPMQKWGSAPYGKGSNTLVDSMSAKVVGIVFDPVAGTGEYDVVEVI